MYSEKTMALYAKACKYLKYDEKKSLPNVDGCPAHHSKSFTAYAMLVIIIEYVQKKEKWVADYNTGNPKYWTWHYVKASAAKPAGFGFSNSLFGCDDADAPVGSRLCFPTVKLEREYSDALDELYVDYKLMT